MEEKKASLVQLHSEYQSVAESLFAAGGELTPETEKELEEILTALCEKTDGYGVVLRQLEAQAEFWKSQKDECARTQKTYENTIESLKNRMRFVLSQTEGEALQGDLYRFFLAKGADKITINEDLLPAAYKKQELLVTPNREAIKAALKAGTSIEGVTVEPTKALREGKPK